MSEIHFSFDKEMRELFEYPDPSIPFVFWIGDFRSFANQSLSYHWHNEFEYCVVLSGVVVFAILHILQCLQCLVYHHCYLQHLEKCMEYLIHYSEL